MFTFGHHFFSATFIFGAFVAIAVARAANVYPLSLILNCGRSQKIPLKVSHFDYYSLRKKSRRHRVRKQNVPGLKLALFLTV